jgi:hypothetical protein
MVGRLVGHGQKNKKDGGIEWSNSPANKHHGITRFSRYSTEISNLSKFFFSNNQPDTLIIPILFYYKTLHVSGIFSAHHQEFSTLHSALMCFMQGSDDRFQA